MKSAHSLEVLFEDQWIIVVGKPSGMLSVGFPGFHGRTAEDILADMHRSRGKVRIGAVHRLDRDTSGVMMFACTAEARQRIMDDWQEIVSERIYRCVCCRDAGALPLPEKGTINAPLAYNRNDVAYVPRSKDIKALKDAEKAITHFRVLARGARYDLVECELETGRKNQIRAHMAHLGHPVAGDDVYGVGDRAHTAGSEIDNPLGRLALHARVLAFTHPFTGTQHRFEVSEPESFAKIVKRGQSSEFRVQSSGDRAERAERPGRESERKIPGKPATRGAPGQKGDGEVKIPRRQRGKSAATLEREAEMRREQHRERDKDIEELTDLTALPKKSRTKQITGKSRFIPGK